MKNSQEFEVDYYFSEKILKQLELVESDEIYKASSETVLHIMAPINYDLVIIGTAHRYFKTFEKITETYNTSVIVHNLNFTELSKFQLFKNIFKKDISFRLKLLLKESLLSASQLYKKAKNQLVLDNKLINTNQKFLSVFYNKFSEKNQNEELTVVIPGAVSQSRRDYKMILEKIKNFKNKTQIIFLGKAKGEELIWLQNFENPNITIKYFTEKVPQSEFDYWMNKANILWCPIQKETEFFSNREIYGETKMTGNIGDAISYGKTAIFPMNYKTDLPFIFQQREDVEQQLTDLSNTQDFNFNSDFSKQKISADLHSLLRSIC